MDSDGSRNLKTQKTGTAISHSAGFLEFKKMAKEFHEVTKQIYRIGRNIEEQHVRIREQLLQLRRNDIDKLLAGAGAHPATDDKWKAHMCEIYALGDDWSLEREAAPWDEGPPPSRISPWEEAPPPPPSRIPLPLPLRVSPGAGRARARLTPLCPNGLAPAKCLCQKPKSSPVA